MPSDDQISSDKSSEGQISSDKPPEDEISFPLSSVLKIRKFRIGRNPLMLAAQPMDRSIANREVSIFSKTNQIQFVSTLNFGNILNLQIWLYFLFLPIGSNLMLTKLTHFTQKKSVYMMSFAFDKCLGDFKSFTLVTL